MICEWQSRAGCSCMWLAPETRQWFPFYCSETPSTVQTHPGHLLQNQIRHFGQSEAGSQSKCKFEKDKKKPTSCWEYSFVEGSFDCDNRSLDYRILLPKWLNHKMSSTEESFDRLVGISSIQGVWSVCHRHLLAKTRWSNSPRTKTIGSEELKVDHNRWCLQHL